MIDSGCGLDRRALQPTGESGEKGNDLLPAPGSTRALCGGIGPRCGACAVHLFARCADIEDVIVEWWHSAGVWEQQLNRRSQ